MRLKEIAVKLNNLNLNEKLLILYIIILPIMRMPSLPLFKQKIQYSDLVFVVLLITWTIKIYRKKISLEKTPFMNILLLICAVFSLSFRNYNNLLHISIELVGFLYLVSLYFIVNQLCLTKKLYNILLITWDSVASMVAIFGIIYYLLFQIIGFKSIFVANFSAAYSSVSSYLTTRMQSFFMHPNMFMSYLHVSTIFLFISLTKIKKNKNIKLLSFFSLSIFLICSILTKSRLIAGYFLSIFLISLWWQRSKLAKFAHCILFVITLLSLVFSLATTIWLIFPIKFEVDHNQRKAAIIYNYLNSSYFFEHQAAWVMFKDYPFLGVGLGEYYHLSTRYIDWDAACAAYRFIDPTLTDFYKQNIDPHSTYLGWLAETGIIGLGSILLFFILFIKGLINSIFLSKDFNDKYVLGCFFAGILGFLWNAIYIDILTMRHFWFMLAMSAVFMNKRVMQDWN